MLLIIEHCNTDEPTTDSLSCQEAVLESETNVLRFNPCFP